VCNINYLITKSNNTKELKHIFNMFCSATANSYATNKDGDGVYINNKLELNFKFIDKQKYFKDFKISKEILSHQRIATSGFSFENLQPFINDKMVMVHNGVLNNDIFYKDKGLSDTKHLFNLITEDNKKDMVKSIKKYLNYEEGYFSIFIKDIINNNRYYFKNEYAQIYIYYINNNTLFITTNKINKLFFENCSVKELTIKDNTIYKIEEDLSLIIVGTLKAMPYNYNYTNFNYKEYSKPIQQITYKEEEEEEEEEEDIKKYKDIYSFYTADKEKYSKNNLEQYR